VRARYGPLTNFLSIVGSFRWLHSPVFLASLALLAVATLICTLESANLISLGWVAVPLALGVALVRWRQAWVVPAAVAAIGLAGMAFPLAVALIQRNVARGVGMLYGADLVGGCLGALLGAVLFIPVLGIPQTCGVIALVGLAGLLALV
jgi:predicted membrane-bound spermidine synthase